MTPSEDDGGYWTYSDAYYDGTTDVIRYDNWYFTGRIKYLTYKNQPTKMYLEVAADLSKKVPAVTSGVWMWKKVIEEAYIKRFTVKRWGLADNFYYYEKPKEVIYECTAESTPDGDSCCENHW